MRISDWSSDVCSSDLWAVTLAASIAIDVAAEIVLLQIVRAPEMPRHRPLTREESELSAKVVECNRREAEAYLADVESHAGDGCRVRTRLVVSHRLALTIHRRREGARVGKEGGSPCRSWWSPM